MRFGKFQSAFEFNIELLVRSLEKYSRGRRGAPAKGIGRVTGARVQIPLSPLLFAIYVVRIFLKKLLTNDRQFDRISKLSKTTTHQLERVEKRKNKKVVDKHF